MKRLLSTCTIGLTLALALAGCDRAQTPPASAAAAAAPLQRIDTQAGSGKEAVTGATAVVNYTGWLS